VPVNFIIAPLEKKKIQIKNNTANRINLKAMHLLLLLLLTEV
jgi:hypothetical protein